MAKYSPNGAIKWLGIREKDYHKTVSLILVIEVELVAYEVHYLSLLHRFKTEVAETSLVTC